MSEEFISKLEDTRPKSSSTGFGDPVCDQIFEWDEARFGSTSMKGRCPECEWLRLYDDSAIHQNALFTEYDTKKTYILEFEHLWVCAEGVVPLHLNHGDGWVQFMLDLGACSSGFCMQ